MTLRYAACESLKVKNNNVYFRSPILPPSRGISAALVHIQFILVSEDASTLAVYIRGNRIISTWLCLLSYFVLLLIINAPAKLFFFFFTHSAFKSPFISWHLFQHATSNFRVHAVFSCLTPTHKHTLTHTRRRTHDASIVQA